MWTLFLKLCEYIFPERAEYRIVHDLTIADLLLHLKPSRRNNIVYLLPFNEPCVRAVIHEAKFRRNEKAWRLLGEVLSSYIREYQKDYVLIPIPLSENRLSQRKYNQVEEILKCAQKIIPDLNVKSEVLFRCVDTAPQTSLAKKERLKNMNKAFGLRYLETLKNCNLIIVDDVTTTGATLNSARITLKRHGIKSVICLALAH